CESCLAIEAGTSMDVHELDAASNNGVEAVRDLISRAAIGTPGRTKVYILDEVHMLSTAASNALLKTLEEPPGHVVFILATTDPQKVLPTIKSRTQHLQFSLLDTDELAEHLSWVAGDAGIEITDDALRQVLREGAGSARDTLSALDRVAAGGGVVEGTESVDALVEALADHDTAAAVLAVAADVRRGRDPRLVGEGLLGRLRDVFLASMQADLGHLPDGDREVVTAFAARLSAPTLTRALELLGEALVEMRQAPDPRIPLEVALVRLTRVDSDTSVAALAERLERLE
ncbi:MAG: AAA family ATPase, partial [Acidimicrobiales bacterium]|nr:AAA family ATPase [Acidimicrobiales bacterium]